MSRVTKSSKNAAQGTEPLIGGRLAIDFANLRLPDASSGGPREGFSMFVEFLAASEVMNAAAKSALLDVWDTAPDESAELLERAASVRDALRLVFEARSSGAEVLPGWIDPINEILAHTEGYDRLEPVAGQAVGAGQPEWRLALHARAQGLTWLLTAIARSGAELIAEGPRAPIRMCANPNCGLFFYDDSRTGGRRWCSMAVCGNRAKVAAHYHRDKTRQENKN